MASADFVPLDLLEEDHDAFAEWDRLNPPEGTPNTDGESVAGLLGIATKLQRELGGYAGRDDEDAGKAALQIVRALTALARELRGRGHVGNSSDVERYEEAGRMLEETLAEVSSRRAATQQAQALAEFQRLMGKRAKGLILDDLKRDPDLAAPTADAVGDYRDDPVAFIKAAKPPAFWRGETWKASDIRRHERTMRKK